MSASNKISILKSISAGLKSGTLKPTESLLEELEKVGVNTKGLTKKSNKVYVKKDDKAA